MLPGIFAADDSQGGPADQWDAVRASQAALDRNDFGLAIAILTPIDESGKTILSQDVTYQLVRIFAAQGLYCDAERTIRSFLANNDKMSLTKRSLNRLFFDLLLAWICMFTRGACIQAIKLVLAPVVRNYVARILEPFASEETTELFCSNFVDWIRTTETGHKSLLGGLIDDNGQIRSGPLLDCIPVGLNFQILFFWLQIHITTEVSSPDIRPATLLEFQEEGEKYRIRVATEDRLEAQHDITLHRTAHLSLTSNWPAVVRIRHVMLRELHEEAFALLDLSQQLWLDFTPPPIDESHTSIAQGRLYLADFSWNDAHILLHGTSLDETVAGMQSDEYDPDLWFGEKLQCQLWIIDFMSMLDPGRRVIVGEIDLPAASGITTIEAEFGLLLGRARLKWSTSPAVSRRFKVDCVHRSRLYTYLSRRFDFVGGHQMEPLIDLVTAQATDLESAGAYLHAFSRHELLAQLHGLAGDIKRCRTEHERAYLLAKNRGLGAKFQLDARLGATTAIEIFSEETRAGTAQIPAAIQEIHWYETFLRRNEFLTRIGDLHATYGLLVRLYYQLGDDAKCRHYLDLVKLPLKEQRSGVAAGPKHSHNNTGGGAKVIRFTMNDTRLQRLNGRLVDRFGLDLLPAILSLVDLDVALDAYDEYVKKPETISQNLEFVSRLEKLCNNLRGVERVPRSVVKANYYLAQLKWRTLQLQENASMEETRQMREGGISNARTVVERSKNVRLVAAAEHVWAGLIINRARIRKLSEAAATYDLEILKEVIEEAMIHAEKEQRLHATQRQRFLALSRDTLKGWEAKRSYIDRIEQAHDSLFLAQFLIMVGRDKDAWMLVQRTKARAMTEMLGLRLETPWNLEFRLPLKSEAYKLLTEERELLSIIENGTSTEEDTEFYWRYHELLGKMRDCSDLKDILALRGEQSVTKEEVDEILSFEDDKDMLSVDRFRGNVCFAEWGLFGCYYYLFTLQPEEPVTSYRLCREDWGFEKWIADNLNRPTLSRTSLATQALNQLEFLLEPLGAKTNKGDLIILCPTGLLHRLPLHTLLCGGQVLIERNPVIYSHSVSSLRYCFHQARNRSNSMYHPNLSVSVLGDLSGDRKSARISAAEVVKLLEADRVLIGKPMGASNIVDAVKATLSGADIVHYHSHATHDSEDTDNLGLWISSDAKIGIQGIASLKLNPGALISLIACGSYSQNWTECDEGLGIVPAFLYAGASSAVATLWPTVSSTGATFSTTFYRRLREATDTDSKTESCSLNLATLFQRSVLEARKQNPSPYHWAAFALTGYWYFRWRKPLEEPEDVEMIRIDIEDILNNLTSIPGRLYSPGSARCGENITAQLPQD